MRDHRQCTSKVCTRTLGLRRLAEGLPGDPYSKRGATHGVSLMPRPRAPTFVQREIHT
jgi:hypothetical protein